MAEWIKDVWFWSHIRYLLCHIVARSTAFFWYSIIATFSVILRLFRNWPVVSAGVNLAKSLFGRWGRCQWLQIFHDYSEDMWFMHGMTRQSGHNTRLDARSPPSFLCMDTWMIPQLSVGLICKLCGSLVCLAYFLMCYPWVSLQQGTDRRSVDWCRN